MAHIEEQFLNILGEMFGLKESLKKNYIKNFIDKNKKDLPDEGKERESIMKKSKCQLR